MSVGADSIMNIVTIELLSHIPMKLFTYWQDTGSKLYDVQYPENPEKKIGAHIQFEIVELIY